LGFKSDNEKVKVEGLIIGKNFDSQKLTKKSLELIEQASGQTMFFWEGKHWQLPDWQSEDTVSRNEKQVIFSYLKENLGIDFFDNLTYYLKDDYLLLGIKQDLEIVPALIVRTPDSLEANEKLTAWEEQLALWGNHYFSQKKHSFRLPDDTKTTEIKSAQFSFEDDLIEGTKVRKLQFGERGIFYGFQDNYLFLTFDWNVLNQLIKKEENFLGQSQLKFFQKAVESNCSQLGFANLEEIKNYLNRSYSNLTKNKTKVSPSLSYLTTLWIFDYFNRAKFIFDLIPADQGLQLEGELLDPYFTIQ
jgi:hypothetical protein